MKSVAINTRVNPELKKDVEEILGSLGLTTSQAITLYLQQIRLNKGIPFRLQLPTTAESSFLSVAKEVVAENQIALKELAK